MDELDYQLLALLQQGLPVCSRPYQQLGQQLSVTETEVISRISRLQQAGVIKRFAVIVNHRLLGYRANAMIVWDVPDDRIEVLGNKISQIEFVSLCYQRPRQGKVWPYNLYCMIHGKSRDKVLQQLERLKTDCHLQPYDYQVLFSKRCFKQRGAFYPARLVEVS
jgi:DNA-binding Lrp family transcriptional regulator